MTKFLKTILLIFLALLSIPVYSNNIFPFSIGKNQVLDYNQTRALSIFNYLLSKTIESPKVKSYTIEFDTNSQEKEKLKFSESKIIFYNTPTEVLLNKKLFVSTAKKIIFNALQIDNKGVNDLSEYENQAVNWIFTALHRRFVLMINQKFIPLRASFPCMHYMLISGINLESKTIIESQLYYSSGFKYEAYAEMCEILLITVLEEKKGKEIISNYIKSSILKTIDSSKNQVFESNSKQPVKQSRSRGTNNLGYISTDKQNSIPLDVSKELNKTALYYSINSFMPASVEFSLKKFEELIKIEYISKNNPNLTKTCSLKHITDNIDSMDSPTRELKNIWKKFNQVQEYFPYFMKKPVMDIAGDLIKLIDLINNNSIKDMSEIQLSINNSINRLYKESKKQETLNNMMFLCELKNIKAMIRFGKHLNIIDESNNYNKDLWPELNRYLDKQNRFYH